MEELGSNLTEKGQHDYKLVQQALEGDQRAFGELLERYRDSVYFTLLKMVNNKDDADDLTIEAFGKAFKRLHQYSPAYAFSTWLFKIASNNCIDFMRSKKVRPTFSLDRTIENDEGGEISIDVKADSLTPEERIIKKQKIKLMHEIVTKLKPRYRSLIEMRYFNEMSYDEISQELGIPLGTVKAQLFRAREFLLQLMHNSKGGI